MLPELGIDSRKEKTNRLCRTYSKISVGDDYTRLEFVSAVGNSLSGSFIARYDDGFWGKDWPIYRACTLSDQD